jgi:homoserine kinase
MQRKLEQSRMIEFQSAADRHPDDIVAGMYLGILSRFPTAAETKTAEDYLKSGIGRRQATVDLAWALMNSSEFLYRH